MPTTRQRQRDLAIARKHYETEFLFAEDEIDSVARQPLKLNEANVKTEATLSPGSPVSVASALDAVLPGEIKSILLPGAWVTVGKGGKPVKDGKMYDEPVVTALLSKKKKKKQKKKMLTAEAEPEPLLVLEEAASSSTSLREFMRSSTRRTKQLARSKDAKFWAGYQQAKLLQRGALDELVAKLMLADGGAEDEAAATTPSTQPMKDHKANSSKDKARRRARSAAATARCSIWLDDEPSSVPMAITRDVEQPPSPWVKVQMSGELELVGSKKLEPKPPGAWTTVGKRGKSMSNFPPLTPSGKAEPKRRESPPAEASGTPLPASKRAKGAEASAKSLPAGKRGKGMQCSVM